MKNRTRSLITTSKLLALEIKKNPINIKFFLAFFPVKQIYMNASRPLKV
jgi:hypothetical protein